MSRPSLREQLDQAEAQIKVLEELGLETMLKIVEDQARDLRCAIAMQEW